MVKQYFNTQKKTERIQHSNHTVLYTSAQTATTWWWRWWWIDEVSALRKSRSQLYCSIGLCTVNILSCILQAHNSCSDILTLWGLVKIPSWLKTRCTGAEVHSARRKLIRYNTKYAIHATQCQMIWTRKPQDNYYLT